jgi:pimeloyl-ACP methyl ester carboxylesterase
MPSAKVPFMTFTRKNVSPFKGLHWLGMGAFKANGYSWEIRRSGELKLGYWRKTLKPKNSRSAYPKRLVLIPGFGDTPLSWYSIVTFLQPVLRFNFDEIILFDFPGYNGFLSNEKCFPSVSLMMNAVSDTLDSLKPHTILGYSLGGWLAGYYASLCGSGKRPLANKKNYSGPSQLLLVSPGGIYSDEEVRQNIEAIFKNSTKEGFSVLRPHFFAKEPLWFRWVTQEYKNFINREDVVQFIHSTVEKGQMECDLMNGVDQIQSKVWIVWGEKDTLIPPSCASAWLKKLNTGKTENHRAILLKGVGHSPHIEKPAIMAAVIGQILSEREPHAMGKRWWTVLESELR